MKLATDTAASRGSWIVSVGAHDAGVTEDWAEVARARTRSAAIACGEDVLTNVPAVAGVRVHDSADRRPRRRHWEIYRCADKFLVLTVKPVRRSRS